MSVFVPSLYARLVFCALNLLHTNCRIFHRSLQTRGNKPELTHPFSIVPLDGRQVASTNLSVVPLDGREATPIHLSVVHVDGREATPTHSSVVPVDGRAVTGCQKWPEMAIARMAMFG